MADMDTRPKEMDHKAKKASTPKQLPAPADTTTSIATPPSTPTPASTAAHDLHREIRSIYQELAPLKSLAPCELINRNLTRLVNLCIEPFSAEVVDQFVHIEGVNTLCSDLQGLCATAEGKLERYWTRNILDGVENQDPIHTQSLLENFPYYQNYIELSRLEASILTPFLTTPPKNIAFIGSGPLPLTSLCLLSLLPTATMHNIDRDPDALALSSALSRNLGHTGRMRFSCEDATAVDEGTEWENFDVVFLAALVGLRSCDKVEVLRGLAKRLRVGTVVVCRSARGMRQVLYPILELSEELQSAGFEVLAEMHPWTSVVNSVIVLRVKERS